MRALFLTLVIILCGQFIVTGQTKPVTLTGKLVMATGEVFPYKVVLTDSADVVKGYSVTYKEPDDTKTTIRGILDRHMRTLNFKEKEIVYSHNVSTKAFMCLVNANLEEVHEAGGNVLKGPITSREKDNTACTEGEIIFDNDKELQNLFAYHEHFDTVISMKKRVRGPEPVNAAPEQKVQEPLVTDKVTAGMEKLYEWHSDTVIIDIWDGGNVDGDRVTLNFNGKTYLSHYTLVKEKKQLHIPIIGADIKTITIFAENEGSEPPNTASITLTDGIIKYNILAYNKKGDAALIRVKKVD